MYKDLAKHATAALQKLGDKDFRAPSILDSGVDASYARLFSSIVKGMEKLVEVGSGPVHTRVRDCLRRAATRVFSNLAYEDLDFDFKKILQVADPDAAEGLEEIIGPHIEELLRQFTRHPEADAPTTGSGQTTV